MANHRDPVPDWLTADYMQNILRIFFKEPEFSVKKIKVDAGSSVGDNYVCKIFRITVFPGHNDERISVIGKFMPNTKMMEELGDSLDLFGIEAKFFETTLAKLNNVKKIDKEFAPQPYYVDFGKKIIFMEDLKEKGFYLQPRPVFLSRAQARIAVEAQATLHGLSYYLIKNEPELKIQYDKTLMTGEIDPVFYKFVDNGNKSLDKWVDTYDFPEEWCKKLRGLKAKLDKDWFKVCERQDDHLNFLLHGDCWKNNMMFHKTNDIVDDIRLLDFQISYYGSFANDLQYFIFSSVASEVILNDLDWLLECYYNKLSSIAPDIPGLSLERIKREFSERLYFGLLMLTLMRPIMIAEIPFDTDNIIDGVVEDGGFKNKQYIADLRQVLPFFEKEGVF